MKLYQLKSNLNGRVLGCEMELNSIEQDLQFVEMDLCYLDRLYEDLCYNIDLLSSGGVIVVLKEYHKSVYALKEIRKEIIKIKNLQIQLRNRLSTKITEYEYFFTEFEKQYNVVDLRPNLLDFKIKGSSGV